MKREEIMSIAQLHGVKVNKLKKTDLVRAIQQAEGNHPCFGSDSALRCGQLGCLWRTDCV